MTEPASIPIPCPFVYATGRKCAGHISCARGACDGVVYATGRKCAGHILRVEAYKADLVWSADQTGRWSFDFRPRSHYHLFCSDKGNHAGYRRDDPAAMKVRYDQLPEASQRVLEATTPDR